MATFTKNHISGSTDGRMIKIAAIATAGTTLHTGPTNTAQFHEVWLYAVNSDTSARKVTIEWGGVSSPDDLIEFTVPAESGLYLIIPGLVLQGNATPLIVTAFSETANVVNIAGYVNEIA